MIKLAIASQKGGVGKTTVSVNLAFAMAQRGWKTLLVDTDPQGSVGLSLSRKARQRVGFFDLIKDGGPVSSALVRTRLPELQILTAGRGELFLNGEVYPEICSRIFGELGEKDFDLIIFDTAAGLGGYTREVLKHADHVLIPLQSEPLGARSLPVVLKVLSSLRNEGYPISLAGVLMTMSQPQVEATRAVEREVREVLPGEFVLPGHIPRDPEFLEASARGVPLALMGGQVQSASALAFDHLAAALESKIGLQKTEEEEPTDGHTSLMD